MKTLTRRAWLKITYDNKNISSNLAPFLKSFSYNDVMSGEADDIDITLEDRQGIWKGDWLSDKGAMLNVSILTQAWWMKNNKIEELPLGIFEIDEIEMSGQPEEVKIKGVSVPNNSALRGEDKSRSWEKTKLSVIGNDIATGAGMALYYDTEDVEIDRVEQSQQSDLSFLMKLCKDHGLALKISDNQIIIFDEVKYEQAKPIVTITKGQDLIKSYSIKSSTRDVYCACHVKYKNAKTNEVIEYTFTLPGKKGKTLEVNEEVKSIAEAEKLAKKKLREKNKDEVTMSITLVGAFYFSASSVYEIKGFGKFDGNYIATRANHDIGSGYIVSMDLRRCLDGY